MNIYRKYLPPAALIGSAAILSLFATLMLRRASKPDAPVPVLLDGDTGTTATPSFIGPPKAVG